MTVGLISAVGWFILMGFGMLVNCIFFDITPTIGKVMGMIGMGILIYLWD